MLVSLRRVSPSMAAVAAIDGETRHESKRNRSVVNWAAGSKRVAHLPLQSPTLLPVNRSDCQLLRSLQLTVSA